MIKVHGYKVGPITYKEPGNGLPEFVKETAAERGYADAADVKDNTLTLWVSEDDIDKAFDCAAHGDGKGCVMAQAAQRLGVKEVYFYRTTAWVDFYTGPIVRFMTTPAMHKNVIAPFDRGERENIQAGQYILKPAKESRSLKNRRDYEKTKKKNAAGNRKKKPIHAHTERVVMAAQA